MPKRPSGQFIARIQEKAMALADLPHTGTAANFSSDFWNEAARDARQVAGIDVTLREADGSATEDAGAYKALLDTALEVIKSGPIPNSPLWNQFFVWCTQHGC